VSCSVFNGSFAAVAADELFCVVGNPFAAKPAKNRTKRGVGER